jgi:hypothetical protein
MEHISQEEITPSDEYIKGFNEGYILAKYSTNFSKDNMPDVAQSDRGKGFNSGMIQYDIEKKLERSMSNFFKDRHTPEKDQTKDKEDRDIERE